MLAISVPLLEPICIPVEIAVDKKSISNDFDPINQSQVVSSLKNDILKNYREYYKTENDGKPIRESFIVITKDFYDDLPLGRNRLCTEINYQNKNYFLADLEMMKDIHGITTNDIIELQKVEEGRKNGEVVPFDLTAICSCGCGCRD